MDVLGGHINAESAAFKVGGNFLKRSDNFIALAFINNSLLAEHRRVSNGAADVLLCHTAVKGN